MSEIERLMVAAPVSELQVGDNFESLPPHMTVIPWFDLDSKQWSTFDNEVRENLIGIERFGRVVGAEKDIYGPDKDVAVTRLSGLLFSVHAFLYVYIKSIGGKFDESYTGLDWSPHISDSKDFKLEVGQELKLSNLAVLKKTIGEKVVKAVYDLDMRYDETTT